MTVENQNVTIFSGDDHTLIITVDDGEDTPVPIDITGFTIWWHAARKSSSGKFSSKSSITKDNDLIGGIIITDGPNGVFEVDLDKADTAALSGNLYHEAQVRDLAGNISTVMTGDLEVKRDLVVLE